MYLDCCKYVYIFTWRGCDIYMGNLLLGDNQEQKQPLFLSILLHSKAKQLGIRPISRLTSLNTGQDLNVHNVEDISRKGKVYAKWHQFLTWLLGNASHFLHQMLFWLEPLSNSEAQPRAGVPAPWLPPRGKPWVQHLKPRQRLLSLAQQRPRGGTCSVNTARCDHGNTKSLGSRVFTEISSASTDFTRH